MKFGVDLFWLILEGRFASLSAVDAISMAPVGFSLASSLIGRCLPLDTADYEAGQLHCRRSDGSIYLGRLRGIWDLSLDLARW